jgi:hypothetical protein
MTDAVRSAEVGDRPVPTRGRRALAVFALLATAVAVGARASSTGARILCATN